MDANVRIAYNALYQAIEEAEKTPEDAAVTAKLEKLRQAYVLLDDVLTEQTAVAENSGDIPTTEMTS